MQIILIKDVPKLGKRGQVKNVADGYALNFLIPAKLAEVASAQKIAKFKEEEIKLGKNLETDNKKSTALAEKIKALKLVIKGKTTEKGKLFAGVGAKEVAAELKSKDIEINEKHIKLKKHIKETGEYKVGVDLGGGIKSEIRLKIEA